MSDATILLVSGTVAATLSALLLLTRVSNRTRRLGLVLARRWPSASGSNAALAIAPLTALALLCFSAAKDGEFSVATTGAIPSKPEVVGSPLDSEKSARAYENLKAFSDRITAKQQTIASMSAVPGSVDTADADLPAVDTMIARLAERLEKEPNDAKGWKMLGWSYLNTGKAPDAVKAYERALSIMPGDAEATRNLEEAKAALATGSVATQLPAQDGKVPNPSTADMAAIESMPADQRSSMIRGMVDRLATRLETAPHDEDGWVRLMRARMVLGEKDAAKVALTKALETFGSDVAVKDRLSASARELGVESN